MTTTTQPHVDLEALNATVVAVTADRQLGEVSFTLHSESTGGLTANSQSGPLVQAGQADDSRTGQFTLRSDEPAGLLGSDTAPSPAEYTLKALAGCYTATLAFLAADRQINLDQVRLTLRFDHDLAGFLGIDSSVRKGARGITVDVELDSPDATPEQLDDLVEALERTSPIRDTLANPVEVTTRRTN